MSSNAQNSTDPKIPSWQEMTGFFDSVTREVQSLLVESLSFSNKIDEVSKQAIRDIESLPECPDKTLRTKLCDFSVSSENAISSSRGYAEQCNMLAKGWGSCADFFTHPLSGKGIDLEVAKCVEKLNDLLPMLNECGIRHALANEKLKIAIRDCLNLANECDNLKKKTYDEQDTAALKGIARTFVLGVGTFGSVLVAGPLGPLLSVGLCAATINSGVQFWSECSRLEKLASDFNNAGGKLRSTQKELESLMEIITGLRQQVENMAKNIEKAHKTQMLFKNALDAKNKETNQKTKENEDLKKQNQLLMEQLSNQKTKENEDLKKQIQFLMEQLKNQKK